MDAIISQRTKSELEFFFFCILLPGSFAPAQVQFFVLFQWFDCLNVVLVYVDDIFVRVKKAQNIMRLQSSWSSIKIY